MTPEERIDRIRSDHWIAFDRATIVLNRLASLMEMPQQSRMPGLMVYGSSGIGKTMIAKRMASKYPTQYNADLGITKTPILLVQAAGSGQPFFRRRPLRLSRMGAGQGAGAYERSRTAELGSPLRGGSTDPG